MAPQKGLMSSKIKNKKQKKTLRVETPMTFFSLYFQAGCPLGSELSIQEALLGRMSASSRCINQNDRDHHIGCYDSVVVKIREKCDGRNVCRFPVTELGPLVSSCPSSTMPYLYVRYQCMQGSLLFSGS